MHRAPARYYLYCQTVGWSMLTVTLVIFNPMKPTNWPFLAEYILPGLLITHLLRTTIRHYHWLNLPFRRSLIRILPALLFALTAAALIRSVFPPYTHFPVKLFPFIVEYNFAITPWLIIYVVVHQVKQTRETAKRIHHLEHLVKEQQTSTVRPAIDIEDLTGTLDRIRALIDQDPNSARREITTFSRLLRSGHLKS
ncbi:MAG TPA: hypothetical protein VL978_17170 [Puia sp.]|nr:hypothetical protein [Puia sp.]